MKKAFCITWFLLVVSLFATEKTVQKDPEVYLGSIENVRIIAGATSVTAQAVLAWPSEEKEGEFNIREEGEIRSLPEAAIAPLKKLLASRPIVPNVKYGCSTVFRIRLTFRHAARKVELLVLLGHGGFAVVDGCHFVMHSGALHFPEAERVFDAALLTSYSQDEMKIIRQLPDELPQPAPAPRAGG